jgi:hypothetical protein
MFKKFILYQRYPQFFTSNVLLGSFGNDPQM